jgi:hypothetical protein
MKILHLRLSTIIIFAISFTSCQKVIDLDLDTSSPQIVIEGVIYDHSGPFTVKISKSVSLDDGTNAFPAITGAMVVIGDNIGNSDTLKESSPGFYITSTLQGVPGRTYNLTVIAEGQIYIASSTMPYAVAISSISIENSNFGNEKQIIVKFKDPADTTNYYRIVEFVNSEQQDNFNVTNDNLNEGKEISYSIMQQGIDNEKLETGDHITIWLEAIDNGIFEYFRQAGREGGQSASPANPTSNINNGALGFFNACSVTEKSIVFP